MDTAPGARGERWIRYSTSRGRSTASRWPRVCAALAREGIFIGGSSWKYEGWLGQIYRGRAIFRAGGFRRRLFEEKCLSEYATMFPAVCGDFAFYQFPSEEFWRRLFAQTPATFQFAFKVPEQITCNMFPAHARYGAQGGMENRRFWTRDCCARGSLRPLLPYREKTAVLIFEFGTFPRKAFECAADFLERWIRFCGVAAGVPVCGGDSESRISCAGLFRVSARARCGARLQRVDADAGVAAADRDSGFAHGGFSGGRALLRRGRAYEEAVKMFSPYAEVREVNESARQGLREMMQVARAERKTAFLFVNNRLEGNAVGTIVAITDD